MYIHAIASLEWQTFLSVQKILNFGFKYCEKYKKTNQLQGANNLKITTVWKTNSGNFLSLNFYVHILGSLKYAVVLWQKNANKVKYCLFIVYSPETGPSPKWHVSSATLNLA